MGVEFAPAAHGASVRRWKPYPDYKDSGVEWLGEIPVDWDIWKISHAFTRIGSGTTPSTNDMSFYDGNIPWVITSELRENIISDTLKKITDRALEEHSALILYPSGTLLIAMYGATIGRLGILGISACTNQACCAFADPMALDIKFAFYWLWMRRQEIIILSSGGGQPNINQEKLKDIRIPAPLLPEQRSIASFLDRKTAHIDILISRKERLITLLQEKRAALISHTVTKGLDPDVPMKDSGVEWLGEIPVHWQVQKLKHICSLLRDGTHQPPSRTETGIPLLSVRNIVDGQFINLPDDSLISEKDFKILQRSFEVKINDVLLAIVGATIGKIAVVKEMPSFAIQRSLAVFRPIQNITNYRYLSFFFQSLKFQQLLWSNVSFSAQQYFRL